MCFLNATDSDVVFMEDMLQVCLLVVDSLCVPMHHIDWLMSICCSWRLSVACGVRPLLLMTYWGSRVLPPVAVGGLIRGIEPDADPPWRNPITDHSGLSCNDCCLCMILWSIRERRIVQYRWLQLSRFSVGVTPHLASGWRTCLESTR